MLPYFNFFPLVPVKKNLLIVHPKTIIVYPKCVYCKCCAQLTTFDYIKHVFYNYIIYVGFMFKEIPQFAFSKSIVLFMNMFLNFSMSVCKLCYVCL